MIRSIISIAGCVAFLALSVPTFAQQCLHGVDESAEQKARKREALSAARQVNTLQANRPDARNGKFLNQTEMAVYYADLTKQRGALNPALIFDPASEVLPGWQLTLDKTEKGYWFMIKDKTDPCGFAYVSNHEGVILTAEPIR